MKQFNIHIFDLYLDGRTEKINGVAIVETEEDAIKEFKLNYKNIVRFEHRRVIDWFTFKDFFGHFLPEEYQLKYDDLFDDDEFPIICQLALQIITKIMREDIGNPKFINYNLN